jgi:alanyl-tRNA synthetase
MTDRLYYDDSFLHEFDAEVIEIRPPNAPNSRPALILDRTGFYPTSGGQVFDTGYIVPVQPSTQSARLRIIEVVDADDGRILHYLEGELQLKPGDRIHGIIDIDRRRDHMQQHSGQHVLSAAFVSLFNTSTVSFHMGAESCSIDLDTRSVSPTQVEAAESLANDVIRQDRKVSIRYVTQEEAKALGLRKLPPADRDKLRLIEIQDFDLSACGGTHVAVTGQIGCILLRKIEKVRQGWRVEFVCGNRAVSTARRDYVALAEAAGLCSSGLWEVPQQIRKLQDDSRAARKSSERLLEEIADLHAGQLVANTPRPGQRTVIVRTFADRDSMFIKLLAQRLVRQDVPVVTLLASTLDPAALAFAQSTGQPFDMGALMREALAQLGGRGGGSKDLAQGGPHRTEQIDTALAQIARLIPSKLPL